MAIEYAPHGLLGVLTPQANTTVEPEMRILTPPGNGWINARLTSDKGTIAERLLDYFDGYPQALVQFGNAPVAAAGFACTGASYLAGRDREDEALERMCADAGYPVHTAASAVVDALGVLGARRIGLVSPYDEALTEASGAYWRSRGFDVVRTASAWRETDAFHPIYSLDSAAALNGLAALDGAELDAVVMLGTGMPTLQPILERPFLGRAPVLSCMLCIAWRMVESAAGREPDADRLLAWVRAEHWRDACRSGQA